jgi:conjugative transfer region protein (TIGR03748 family)
MQHCKKAIILILLVEFIFSNAFAADNVESVGRYLTISNKPLPQQRDLLSQTIQMRFPPNVKTVGDAVNHILRYSGYSLIAANQRSTDLKNTLQKPLPLVDRGFGPMTLRDALTTLIGPAFALAEDPLNREVDFRLKPNFSKKPHHGASR